MIQQKTAVTVCRIDPDANFSLLGVVQMQCSPKGMVLVPSFDSDVMPLGLGWHTDNYYELVDVRGKGW